MPHTVSHKDREQSHFHNGDSYLINMRKRRQPHISEEEHISPNTFITTTYFTGQLRNDKQTCIAFWVVHCIMNLRFCYYSHNYLIHVKMWVMYSRRTEVVKLYCLDVKRTYNTIRSQIQWHSTAVAAGKKKLDHVVKQVNQVNTRMHEVREIYTLRTGFRAETYTVFFPQAKGVFTQKKTTRFTLRPGCAWRLWNVGAYTT